MGIQQILLTTVGGGGTVTLEGYPGTGDASIILSATDQVSQPSFAGATVTIELNSNGVATYSYSDSIGGGTFATYNWLTSGSASDFYAFMDTPSSGTFSTGTVNSNLQLNTTRTWTVSVLQLSIGSTTKNVISTLRLRNSSFTDLITKGVDMTATAITDP